MTSSDLAVDVSRETTAALRSFEDLVRRWTARINLVSKASLADLQVRHTEDSLQLFRFLPKGARRWADLGSGGGFPGLVIAVLAKELAPELRVSLVDSDVRKATFLRLAASELGLSVDVFDNRIESLPSLGADVVSAMALASLVDLLGLVQRHLRPSGMAILPKGASSELEIAQARQVWDFDLETHPSQTAGEGSILIVRAIRQKEQG